jgi:hypothetical protein
LFLSATFVWLLPETATAHGFGQRYDLPIPLPFWVFGAGATILLSFVLVAVFARGTEGSFRYPRVNLFRWSVFQMLAHPAVLFAIRVGGVIALGAGVTAGFWGDPSPYKNLSPVLVWVIWWVGVVYVCALIADLWTFATIVSAQANKARKGFTKVQRSAIRAQTYTTPTHQITHTRTGLRFL